MRKKVFGTLKKETLVIVYKDCFKLYDTSKYISFTLEELKTDELFLQVWKTWKYVSFFTRKLENLMFYLPLRILS